MVIEIDPTDHATVAEFRPHHPGRNTDHGDVWRRALDHNRIGPDPRSPSYGDRSKNLCTGADHHAIFQAGMALARRPRGAAECDAVIERDVIADLGGLANHDAGTMIDEEPVTDFG